MKNRLSYKILSVFLALTILFGALPIVVSASNNSTSVADKKTLTDYENWFPSDSSRFAGGVFTDKSVYTATEAVTDPYFADIKNSLSFGNDNFGNENFMVALSALGSNSEVYGYSYTPTDTMIVLDASTSMGTGDAASSAIDDMVAGANDAAKRLLSLNNYNRVGVVVYNGTSNVLLPLDRYTSANPNSDILQFERSVIGGSGTRRDPYTYENRIYIASNLKNSANQTVGQNYIRQAQGTYTQGGFYAATQEFLNADTVIRDGKIQGGTKRLPIMVFMSDGEPSYRTKTDTNTTINRYHEATNANCDNSSFREDDVTAFSTMLTAAYSEAEISSHYGNDALFYTLGYNLSANHVYAHNVLDPMNPNNIQADRFAGFAKTYLGLAKGATATLNGAQTFRVTRQSDPAKVKSLDYVDKYWQAANAANLTAAFDSIVDEIVIQSRYYSTLVSGNQHHQDGFISFTDEIGTYMEVKNLKGLYIGDGKLVTGGMFSEFATTGTVADYDNENYSDEQLDGFETEILSAMAERFSITTTQANQLLTSAKNEGFISYTDRDNFSNYVAWYADSDNKYIAPYTSASVQSSGNAKYIVRSYFYMGDVMQNHVETSMLYALVRVRKDIQTGREIVDINIPAALLPMVTYTITVNGDTFSQENITGLSCEQKKPISLLFEVGLDSEITPYNLSEKMDGQDFRKNTDGTYTFYTNRWRNNDGTAFTIPSNPDVHVFNHGIMNTTVMQFIPSLENERYYYTENTPVLQKDGNSYIAYTGSKPTGDGYYHEYTWVEKDGNNLHVAKAYNPVSANAITSVIQTQNGWAIPKGTAKRFFVKGETHKDDPSVTGALEWSAMPAVVYHHNESHDGYHVLEYLGNNGKITVAPAQGIKLTKTVSQKVDGATDTFVFDITLRGNGIKSSYEYRLEKADGSVQAGVANVRNNVITVTLGDGDVYYLNGLEVGTSYTVSEQYNAYYSASSTNASGTVTDAYTIYSVDFVNAPKGYGSLLVEKLVTHPTLKTVSNEFEAKEFDITVSFAGAANDLAQISVPSGAVKTSDSVYAVKLKDGADALFTNIPDGVTYTVAESNIPTGFTLKTSADDLEGTIKTNLQSEAIVINEYNPKSVNANITVSGKKTLSGRNWDDSIDKYQVALQRVTFGGSGTVAQGNPIITDVVKSNGADYTIDMSNIDFDKVGIYSYIVYEVVPSTRVENVSYDSSLAMFSVEVVDRGTGQLIIDSVTVHQNTAAVTGDAQNGWTVTKDFTNTYMATTVSFPVKKAVVDNNGTPVLNHAGGIVFGLYASTNTQVPSYSMITDENGNATFVINIKQNDYLTTKYYYLREIIPPVDSTITGMTYDDGFKYAVSINWSNSSQPIVRYYHYTANGIGQEISDINSSPLVITNTYDDGIVSNALKFGGQKTLNGGALRNGDSFKIELYETDATFATDSLTAKATKTVNAQNNRFTFDGITFDSLGTKYLVIKEQKGNAGGIIYDEAAYHITVNVTKAMDGNKAVLKAEAIHIHHVGGADANESQINFNNRYVINDQENIVLGGLKKLSGRTLVGGEFTFGLFEQGGTTPIRTAKNNADGTFTFSKISYSFTNKTTLNESHTYIIKELVPDSTDKKGITYDKTEYTINVAFTDNGDGTVKKAVTMNGKAFAASDVVFTNTYAITKGTQLTFSGTKTLVGLSDGMFNFSLYSANEGFAIIDRANPVKTATANVTNGSGKYSLTVDYPADAPLGNYYYVLEEVVPTDTKGIAYDTTRYDITVNLLDNGNGELEAHIVKIFCPFNDNTYTASTLNFVNRYKAEAKEVDLSAKKVLKNKALAADMFEFEVLDQNDEVIATGKNDANGNVEFSYISLEQPATYKWTIKEINGGKTIDNIVYDKTVYSLTVVVEDNLEGKFEIVDAKLEKDGSEVEEIVFTNLYNEPDSEQPDTSTTSPKTNDTSLFGLWLAVFFVSGGLLTGFALKNKKEQKAE